LAEYAIVDLNSRVHKFRNVDFAEMLPNENVVIWRNGKIVVVAKDWQVVAEVWKDDGTD